MFLGFVVVLWLAMIVSIIREVTTEPKHLTFTAELAMAFWEHFGKPFAQFYGCACVLVFIMFLVQRLDERDKGSK